MNIDFKNTVLLVKDIERSKKFYIDVLNQVIEFDFGLNVTFKSGLSIWEIKDYLPVSKMLGQERLKENKFTRFELYFETENLNKTEEELTKHCVKFLHHVHEEPWGQQTIRFFDPDDHLIEIGEPMRIFLKRFADSGMNPEQISKRTSVSLEQVNEILKKK